MTIFQENFGFKKDLGGANRHRGRGVGIQKKNHNPLNYYTHVSICTYYQVQDKV